MSMHDVQPGDTVSFVVPAVAPHCEYQGDRFGGTLTLTFVSVPEFTIAKRPFKVGDKITDNADLDRLPIGSVIRDATQDVGVKRTFSEWRVAGLGDTKSEYWFDCPVEVLSLPERSS